MTLVSLVLALVLGFALLRAAPSQGLSTLRAGLIEHRYEWAALRLTVIALLAGAWPTLIRGVARRRALPADAARLLLAARWRAVAWLLALEACLGLQLVNSAVRMLKAAIA